MSHEEISPPTRLGRPRQIKAVFFDFMGTCLDWHSSAVDALPRAISEAARSKLALDWRQEFFDELHARSRQGLPPEDIDITHRRALLRILHREPHEEHSHHFYDADRSTTSASYDDDNDDEGASSPSVENAVTSWHRMSAWLDVLPALTELKRDLGVELFVLANGTTRLQLDLARSSGLAGTFSMLFSSEPLGVYKPAPEAYAKALRLVRARPDEAVMVAAHAYDLRAARELGMNTVYVSRWTDDVGENVDDVKRENNFFLSESGMQGLAGVVEAWG